MRSMATALRPLMMNDYVPVVNSAVVPFAMKLQAALVAQIDAKLATMHPFQG